MILHPPQRRVLATLSVPSWGEEGNQRGPAGLIHWFPAITPKGIVAMSRRLGRFSQSGAELARQGAHDPFEPSHVTQSIGDLTPGIRRSEHDCATESPARSPAQEASHHQASERVRHEMERAGSCPTAEGNINNRARSKTRRGRSLCIPSPRPHSERGPEQACARRIAGTRVSPSPGSRRPVRSHNPSPHTTPSGRHWRVA